MAGLSYGASGLLDKPDVSGYAEALVSALSLVLPALLLGGLLGLRCRLPLEGGRSLAGGAGFALGCLGAVLGVAAALGLEQVGLWWWAPLLAGLVLSGSSALPPKGAPRRLGALVLASGMLGWVSLLTDQAFPGVLVPIRTAHVAFAAAFCLSCVLWGGALFLGTRGLGRPNP